jgi:hypothetical protein
MFTSTLVIALAGYLASATLESPSWHSDYGSAQRLGKEGYKPLAVFIGSGKAGWNQLSREGQLAKDVKQRLAKDYVCVYVDVDRAAGKQLASEFQVANGPGLILSDHTGKYQAFYHQGDLPNEHLLHYLGRYASPERIVRTTETNPPEYDPAAAEPYYYQPIPYAPVYSGGGRSC